MSRADRQAKRAGARRKRGDRPVRTTGVLRFSDGAQIELHDIVNLLIQLRSRRWLFQELADACHVDLGWGRPRRQTYWCLVYLAYVMSGKPALKPWWLDAASNSRLWWTCEHRRPKGKRERRRWRIPAYETVRVHFIELEQFEEAFEACAAKLIRLVAAKHPELFEHLFCDGTESDSHVVAHHDCRPDDPEPCPNHRLRRMGRLGAEGARDIRHAETAFDEDHQPEPPPDPPAPRRRKGRKKDAPDDEPARRGVRPGQLRPRPPARRYVDPERGGLRFRAGNHWWWIRDAEVGMRAYSDKDGVVSRCWIGSYLYMASAIGIDVPVASLVFSAAESESQNYERLMARIARNLGGLPRTVAGDRALYTRAIARFNAVRGITTVAPHRKLPSMADDDPYPAGPGWDSDGEPTCPSCSGPTQRMGFTNAGGRPRIFFECLQPQDAGCRGKKSISVLREPRRLLPIGRTSDTYKALAHAAHSPEHHNLHERGRWNTAATSVKDRPKRLGLAVQQLRASAALLLEWLMICLRFGFLGRHPDELEINPLPTPDEVREEQRRLARAKERTRTKRRGPPG